MTRTTPDTHDSLDARLSRLEEVLDAVRLAAAGGNHDRSTGELEPSTLDRLAAVADRLRRLADTVQERSGMCDWDAVDRMAARLLLDHLTIATRDCRTVAAAAAARLDLAKRIVGDIERELDREQQRANGQRA